MALVLWGTWEELVLGSAVLRHGTADWEAVATELHDRTAFPDLFTPQVCAAKYEDLQERYSGCDAWFEELRSQRVADLKKELEKSEDSIGSLQSKLESLTAEKESDCNNLDYDASRTQSMSISPRDVADEADYFCKVASMDELSAGSYTRNIDRERATECEIDFRVEKAGNLCADFGCGNFRRKRAPRKRKPCSTLRETSVGESQTRSCAAKVDGEDSSEGFMPSSEKFCAVPAVDLAGILDSISKHKDVSILLYRIGNQKNSKYKKLIRRHVDFETISSGISNGSISSARELFRDLLLLCNNTLVFHNTNSPEHQSAHSLRKIVLKTLRHTLHSKKLRSGMACKSLIGRKALVTVKGAESPARKRGIGRPPKGGRRGGRESSSSSKGRKKARS